MFCSIVSSAISGVEAVPVTVEADVSEGMPYFAIVGSVSSQVREAQERVRTAFRNIGIVLAPKRITINLAPGDIRKDGTRFDLPIATAVLEALGYIEKGAFRKAMVLGELHLDGTIEKIPGVLPSVIAAKENGCELCIVPTENAAEGSAVDGIRIVGVRNISELIAFSHGKAPASVPRNSVPEDEEYTIDFSDIHGQKTVKRAALIAAAGFHNLFLSGPPGSGKSMTAERIPTILPPLSEEESLEVSKIYSVVGLMPRGVSRIRRRPFRAPHHTITPTALCGGGFYPHPGEVTLAHRGVLFLDEIPEMMPATLEMLRQPLESREITISRLGGTCVYPASFLLVAAANPCPCGYFPDMNRCICTHRDILDYQKKLSKAFMDRIDLKCDVQAVSYESLTEKGDFEVSSSSMRKKVMRAIEIQKERYRGTGVTFNSELTASSIAKHCEMTDEAELTVRLAFDKLGLSARGYHHVIKVARTIADLEGTDRINDAHISEAICLRCSESFSSASAYQMPGMRVPSKRQKGG